ncbi:MAG: DNA cytosine methyltransferase [Endomicrobium sp.]|jgi:DNA (cytosine-5)-methyltransferase 1|nr:DNA cytosine methyltransferase [Endomicrobium sp.]
MYKFIDLFCGIGGFRVALEKRKLECVFSSDIDAYAQEAYERNFGEKPIGDIMEIPEKKIPKHDILCAGFPCQSFSISGKRVGISDPRGRLFYEIQRIAGYHEPYILLLENVKNILTIDGGNVVKTIQTNLDKIGYNLYKHVLNASYFGIPQARERVYFVALRKDMKTKNKPALDYAPPKENNKKIFLADILEKEVDKKFFIHRKDIEITKKENEVENKLEPIRVGIVNKGGQGERIYSPKGHAITQSAYGGGVGARTGLYNTEQGIRRLTINECKKVMGFPVRHIVSGGMQGYQQLGNAVVPEMIGHVYDSVKEVL